ncbi:mechanosensitive ion channel [Candidatus Peribacteria bacterium]|nr:mechanosensitive ion channel [Candidatus Peribacteria bacterium]
MDQPLFNASELFMALKVSLLEILNQFVTGLPKLVIALLIIILGALIASAFRAGSKRLFRAIGIDKLADAIQLDEVLKKAQVKMTVSSLLAKIIYYIIFLVFLTMGLEKLDLQVVNEMIHDLLGYIPNIFGAIIILLVGSYGAKILSDIVRGAANAAEISYSGVLARLTNIVVMVFVIVIALGQLGMDTTLFTSNITNIITAIIAAGALAAGLGGKTLLSNLMSAQTVKDGIDVGDTLHVGEMVGVVVKTTSLGVVISRDGKKEFIPAAKLMEMGYGLQK